MVVRNSLYSRCYYSTQLAIASQEIPTPTNFLNGCGHYHCDEQVPGARISDAEDSKGKKNIPVPYPNPSKMDLLMEFLDISPNLDGSMIMIVSYERSNVD